MPDDDNQMQTVSDTASDPPPGTDRTTATFSQDQLDQIIGQRTAQVQRTAAKALLDDLGFSSKADLERFVKAAKDVERAQMTEAERLSAEAKELIDAARIERETYAARTHNLAVREALIEAGVAPAKAARAVKLVETDIGADDTTIRTAVETVRAEFPELFGTGPAPKATSSEPSPGGPPPQRNTGQTPWERGRAEAQARMAARGQLPVPAPQM